MPWPTLTARRSALALAAAVPLALLPGCAPAPSGPTPPPATRPAATAATYRRQLDQAVARYAAAAAAAPLDADQLERHGLPAAITPPRPDQLASQDRTFSCPAQARRPATAPRPAATLAPPGYVPVPAGPPPAGGWTGGGR